MLSSGLCEGVERALFHSASEQVDAVTRRLPYEPEGPPDPATLRQVARDFASLLYSILVRQMQATVKQDTDDDGPIKQGVRDFLAMLLPQAVADSPGDVLARYLHQHLSERFGERLDEEA